MHWCLLSLALVCSEQPSARHHTVCLAQAAFPGLGAIALDALTRREWVKEDELAQQLKVHPKVLRRVLRYLEQVPTPASSTALVTCVFGPRAVAGCSLYDTHQRCKAWCNCWPFWTGRRQGKGAQ